MALDAGAFYVGSSTAAAGDNGLVATSEVLLGSTVLTTGNGKSFFLCPDGGIIIEYGVWIQTTTSATALVMTLSVAPAFGGAYTAATGLAGGAVTCTGPSAGLLASSCLRKTGIDIQVNRGNIVRMDVTTGVAAGTGIIYLKFQPAGDSGKGTNDILSLT